MAPSFLKRAKPGKTSAVLLRGLKNDTAADNGAEQISVGVL